jgi:uncharacterized protein YdeI (YjbR/CyaY-like superfamily)
MSVPHADRERVHPETRAEWRAWLAANAATRSGVWLVFWRKQSGRPVLSYVDAVEEALCFGWIDSQGRGLDDERTMLYFAPRKPGSAWSRPNKQRVERLLAAGAMAPAGLRAVEAAKRDGSWRRLDEVEDLVVPDDLAAAFDRHPGAREQWDAFPRSPRRAMLEWIVQARRPETRAKRVEQTARSAARGERANERPRNT